MADKTQTRALFLCLLICISTTSGNKPRSRRPCKELVFYFHDILYHGYNYQNATSAIVGSPKWGNKTAWAQPFAFGDLIVFDDPITLDNNLHSPPVGRAQGMYAFAQRTDPLMNKTRDISVIGGTGDFFMARGVATLSTDAFEGEVYFRLRVDIRLYECW
ncbi:Hypothetical predicted protein [Olea europaea subsp. europaea]|uniref:Dirigent protein n=1 Tax=Olea europaea subsp. europaea TaxID=158383 RepID=A0A8S0QSZ4_OLEEU|nr:Hypothetical predicted protein [Olea europaea subsp. europaea]